MMLGAEATIPPLTRARLEELAAAYPDQGKGKKNG
ncbi:MAG: phage tail assembly chaperone [Rhodobacteraceae bacterium]|nr:phage tail assembly chaperone [Paracoccaceae bacterium]